MRQMLIALAALAGLAACQSSNTFGPYPATVGRYDCAFSTRFENGGICPSIPTPTIEVARVQAPEKGCGAGDYFSNFFSCPAPDIAPGEEALGPPEPRVYCYKSLGVANCYTKPDQAGRPVTTDPPQ